MIYRIVLSIAALAALFVAAAYSLRGEAEAPSASAPTQTAPRAGSPAPSKDGDAAFRN